MEFGFVGKPANSHIYNVVLLEIQVFFSSNFTTDGHNKAF